MYLIVVTLYQKPKEKIEMKILREKINKNNKNSNNDKNLIDSFGHIQ